MSDRDCKVPQELYDSAGDISHRVSLLTRLAYRCETDGYELSRMVGEIAGQMRELVRLAYCSGYSDGCRDGHVDAEDGHCER